MPESLHLNLVDLLLALVVAAGLLGGWRRGFVSGTLTLLVLAASLAAALATWERGAALLHRHAGMGEAWAGVLAFMLVFVGVRIAAGMLANRMAAAVPARVVRHPAHRAAGLVPGLAMGLVHAAILALLLLSVAWFDRLAALSRESALAQPLARPAAWVEARLRPVFEPALAELLGPVTVTPGLRERIELPFTLADAPVRPELEARLLVLVNEERARHGLPALRADPELAQVARAHARDMFARGYFSHVTPEGVGPFERMRQAGVHFWRAGENLALAPSLALAHKGLMESPGHRANILRPGFGRVGIGVLDGGPYGLMVAQKFRN